MKRRIVSLQQLIRMLHVLCERFQDHTNPNWATGDGVLSYYSMSDANVSHDLLTLMGYAIAFQVLYYVILKLKDRRT
jgi:hypothetical protein